MRPKAAVQTREVRGWLVKVSHDLRVAESALKLAPPVTDAAMFHCQQAVEKALKAFLVWHKKPLLRTHDLRLLGDRCASIDASLGLLSFRTDYLSEFAVQGRYPGEERDPSPREARRALSLAREAVDAVLDRLPRAVRPRGIRL